MTLLAKVKVTVTLVQNSLYNLAMLGARTLKRSRDVSSDKKVKATMTFRTAFLLAMLCIT